MHRNSLKATVALLLLSQTLRAQAPAGLAQERADFAHWLATAPNSPLIARAFVPVRPSVRIGPDDAEVPFPGVNVSITERSGAIALEGSLGQRALSRNRLVSIPPLNLMVSGLPGAAVAVIYGGRREEKVPTYYSFDPTLIFTGPMQAAAEPHGVRILTMDGLETDATEVGSVTIPDGGAPTRLRVYRITDPGSEESELAIYFRDGTSGSGSYPAGRFVTLQPVANGTFRIDFNRARNPFCAYSSAYPCPAPWPGNTLQSNIKAGEQYHGAGTSVPAP
ncbi:MAG: DUF1684 domain-containing protein [Gemmatimonadota bacterium]